MQERSGPRRNNAKGQEEILFAATALYLASTEASYVTGQTLHVNGGILMV